MKKERKWVAIHDRAQMGEWELWAFETTNYLST
jgi:hypothetical protein